MLAVLCIECGTILLFLTPTATRTYLLLTILFHVSVLMMIGIAFWKWIACEVVIVWAVRRWLKTGLFRHNKATFVFTAALIALGPWWAGPANLSWYTLPLTTAIA